MNIPEVKLYQMTDPDVACPRHGLLMAHSRNIDTEDVTAELLGQIARRSPVPLPMSRTDVSAVIPAQRARSAISSGVSGTLPDVPASPCANAAADNPLLRKAS